MVPLTKNRNKIQEKHLLKKKKSKRNIDTDIDVAIKEVTVKNSGKNPSIREQESHVHNFK